MKYKIVSLNVVIFSLLFGCGGGGGGGGVSPGSLSSASSAAPVVSAFNSGNSPSIRTINGIETFPTMIVTINFKNNISLEDLEKLSVVVHISADDVADYKGDEFAYFFEKLNTYYKYTYSSFAGYCCTVKGDTYYRATNSSGLLQLKLIHYGQHTSETWNKLKAGTIRMNVTANFYQDRDLTSVLSTDYSPEKNVFSVNQLSVIDSERDYLGNDATADISTASVEMFF